MALGDPARAAVDHFRGQPHRVLVPEKVVAIGAEACVRTEQVLDEGRARHCSHHRVAQPVVLLVLPPAPAIRILPACQEARPPHLRSQCAHAHHVQIHVQPAILAQHT
eukprot:scaffold22701_cov74-Phaeocystis_antarctica.AAC.4